MEKELSFLSFSSQDLTTSEKIKGKRDIQVFFLIWSSVWHFDLHIVFYTKHSYFFSLQFELSFSIKPGTDILQF